MYTESKPKYLSSLVSTIWHSDSDVDPNEGYIVPPSLGSQLVIKIYSSAAETVLSGPVTQQKQYPFVEGAAYFGIEFVPNAGSVFNDFLLKELQDSSFNVHQVLGIDLMTLAHQLHESKGWMEQRHLLEAAVCRNYPVNGRFQNPNVLLAMEMANSRYGNIAIRELAAYVGVSQRQLERLFLRHTGLSPKTFCTTLRIQHVLNLLRCKQQVSLAHLALRCGYSDQAHLANEFRQVMGTTISAYLKSATYVEAKNYFEIQ
ncbi:helix-turn-helix domain-containing protein [Candidatus Leptofilum sp.]|uniref:helix-turn-helix domain-containing protein n=1 Tax=Candidatus Leptofilum sp. TaxID=3241576 RepID=UPI003B5BDA16